MIHADCVSGMTHNTQIESAPKASRRGLCLGISAVSTVICVALAFSAPQQFWPGYLVAANYWVSISLGCLGILLIHSISGGRWGYALGRGLHAGAATLPLVLILAAILAIDAGYALPWAAPNRADLLNRNQIVFLDPWMVGGRYVVMSLIWIAFAVWLRGLYRREAADRSKTPPQGLAGAAMLVFFLTVSCASVDYVMALSPGWASSIFPLLRILNCAISAMAVMILARAVHKNEPHHHYTDLTHDAGNWLQAFNLLWAYMAISQYLLIWGGDIPMEVQWYMDRRTPLGIIGSVSLFVFHWLVPFLLLLLRPLKKNTKTLSGVAILMLVMCFVDIAWITLPSIRGTNALSLLSAVVAVAAIGGFWVAEFSRQYAKLPDMYLKDTRFGAHAHDASSAHVGEAT